MSKKKGKYDKNSLKAVFCLLELLVYIQLVTCTGLSCNAQFSYWFPLFTLFVEDLWKHAASKFFDEIDIFREKMSLKRRRKIDQISWYYWICLELSISNEHTYVVLEWELTLNCSGRARKIRVYLWKKLFHCLIEKLFKIMLTIELKIYWKNIEKWERFFNVFAYQNSADCSNCYSVLSYIYRYSSSSIL